MNKRAKVGIDMTPWATVAAGRTLPLGSNWILGYQGIGREQKTVMFNGLADEHTIKWVPVQSRELVQVEDCTFVKGKHRDAMALSLLHEKPIHWTRQEAIFPTPV